MDLVVVIALVFVVIAGANALIGGTIPSMAPIIGAPVVIIFAIIGVLATVRAIVRAVRAWWDYVRVHHLTERVEVERTVVIEKIVEKPVLLVDREIQLRTALAHLPLSQQEREELLAYVMEETRQLPNKLENK